MGVPVVIADNGLGFPVRPVEADAPRPDHRGQWLRRSHCHQR